MKIIKKKLSELKRPDRNTRMHTDKQIAEFKRSVNMFGQIRPIVIDENNVMLAGNGLYDTLLSLGREEADCYVVTGLSENEKKKLMLADNRIFDLGVDDMSAFDAVIAELGEDLDVPGFDEDLLKSLTADTEEINDMMSSYGIVDESRKTEIAAAKETYAKQSGEFSDETEGYTPSGPNNYPSAEQEEKEVDLPARKYVTCPKCGERIWL